MNDKETTVLGTLLVTVFAFAIILLSYGAGREQGIREAENAIHLISVGVDESGYGETNYVNIYRIEEEIQNLY